MEVQNILLNNTFLSIFFPYTAKILLLVGILILLLEFLFTSTSKKYWGYSNKLNIYLFSIIQIIIALSFANCLLPASSTLLNENLVIQAILSFKIITLKLNDKFLNFSSQFKNNIFSFFYDLLVLKAVFLGLIMFVIFITLLFRVGPLSLRHIGLYLLGVVVMVGIIYPREIITVISTFISFIEINKQKTKKVYKILLGFTLFVLCVFFGFTISIDLIYVDQQQVLFFDSSFYYEFRYAFELLIITITLLNVEVFHSLSLKGKFSL